MGELFKKKKCIICGEEKLFHIISVPFKDKYADKHVCYKCFMRYIVKHSRRIK